MADRVLLSDDELDNVSGGAFNYNTYSNADGSSYMTCRVDGVGTFNCTESAKRYISLFIMNNDSCTLDEVVNYALANGYFF